MQFLFPFPLTACMMGMQMMCPQDANQSRDDENQSGDEGKETPGPVEKRHPQNEPSREVVNSEAAVTAVDGSACCIIA